MVDIFFGQSSYTDISDGFIYLIEMMSLEDGTMYKKAMSLLVLSSCLLMLCYLGANETNRERLEEQPAKTLVLSVEDIEQKEKQRDKLSAERLQSTAKSSMGIGVVDVAVSEQRVLSYFVLESKYVYHLSEEELDVLCRIVEAEAGCEDEKGKLLVANVILNRMNNEAFPDTVSEVVFQRDNGVTQFSPVSDGSYYEVTVSEETRNAVNRALMGEDASGGALYFVARKYADSGRVKWFDEKLTYLFSHGGHEFFK